MRTLSALANLCAIIAGVLLTLITLLTCANLILRNTSGGSLAGAFELTAMTSGAAIAGFMPLCQLRRGNIIVDFFTSGLRESTIDTLDRFGALVLAMLFVLLAWRTSVGGLNAFNVQSQSMLMGIPEWIVYAAMVPPFALTALIGLHQAFLQPSLPEGSPV